MLSTFPATFSFDSFLGNPFPPLETCFPASETTEPALFSPQPPQLVVTTPNSGSDESNQDASNLSEPDPINNSKTLASRPATDDDRKRRRMESNRKSAQRSRMRKQRHMENLTNLAARFKLVNQELTTRLRLALHHAQTVASENDSLRSEAELLRQKLSNIRNQLLLRYYQQHYFNPSARATAASAWPCINNAGAPPLTLQNYCTNII